jgi:WD40 repeat protein
MALACALEWLRGPLMGIQGVIDIVASFSFKFQGVPVRVLPRESTSMIACLVEISHCWAVGDAAGDVSVYDFECEKLLRTYRMHYPVYTIASYGENGFMCNANSGFWVWNNLKSRRVPGADRAIICNLLSFRGDIAASCSNADERVHVYDLANVYLNGQSTVLHSLRGPGRVTDVAQYEDTLISVHETHSYGVVWLWDVRRGTHVHSIPLEFNHIYHIHNVIVNQTMFMFIDEESRVHAYDLETKRDNIVARTDRFCAIPDNRILTSGSDSSFGVVDVTNAYTSDAQVKARSNCFKFVYVRTGRVIVCNLHEVQVWL